MAASAAIPHHVPPELVQNFAFDGDPGYLVDPASVVDAARDGRPIVYAPAGRRGKGTWVFKTYDLVFEALQKPELFSSHLFSGFSGLLGESWPLPPMEYDPPRHRPFRAILQPLFSPRRMSELEIGIGDTIAGILDSMRPRGACEFQSEFAMRLPTTVFLNLVGLPLEDAPDLLVWEGQLMHGATLEDRIAGARSIKDYLAGHIASREKNPRDDIYSRLIHSEVNGEPLTADEKIGVCFLLYSAGLDTVASALGFTFRALALDPEFQDRLRGQPELRPRAIEELLRSQLNNVPGRWVTQDVEFHGVSLRKGDFVSLSTMFANRDPEVFQDPGTNDCARDNAMRHIAFGTGIHNCLGSHLARRELRLAMDAWLDTMPRFAVGARPPVTYGGSVFGVSSLDLAWQA